MKEDLIKMIAEDEFGLLDAKPGQSAMPTIDKAILQFQEINDFVKQHHREPSLDGDVNENMLYLRLKLIRENQEKILELLIFDEFKLLTKQNKAPKTIADIVAEDDLNILSTEPEDDIFTLKYVAKDRAEADFIARRKPCVNFLEFEQKFLQCHQEIKNGKRKLLKFSKDYNMEKGMFFLLKGMLVYLAEVAEKIKDENGKVDCRLRAIFENGTESNLLLRSLGKELFKNGKRVSELTENSFNNFYKINDDDLENGYIYVAKSLSEKEEIRSIKNLYKIGFSQNLPQERVKNAQQDPTFLMASVHLVTYFKCFNISSQKLEQLLHKFFGSACLKIDVYDNYSKRFEPREWFIAPLDVIEQAVNLIITGEIIDYKYNFSTEKIEKYK